MSDPKLDSRFCHFVEHEKEFQKCLIWFCILLGFLGFTNARSHSPFGHVHMFAVIMVAEEEKTEDCVIVTIASNAP